MPCEEDGFGAGIALLKYEDFEASVGVIGEVTGVEEAIVPPIPVREIGGETLSCAPFPTMELVVGVATAVGVIRAGL